MPRKTFMIAALMIVSGSVPARAGEGAGSGRTNFARPRSRNTTFEACFALYPREMSAQINRDVNGVGTYRHYGIREDKK